MSKMLRNISLELCQKLSVFPDPENPYFFPSAATIRHIRDRENAKRRMHSVGTHGLHVRNLRLKKQRPPSVCPSGSKVDCRLLQFSKQDRVKGYASLRVL